MPGNEEEAAALLDAYLERERAREARAAETPARLSRARTRATATNGRAQRVVEQKRSPRLAQMLDETLRSTFRRSSLAQSAT